MYKIENCFVLGNVTGTEKVSGFIGTREKESNYIWPTIKNCYSAAEIIGNSQLSGLYNGSLIKIENCYYDAEIAQLKNGVNAYNDRLTIMMVRKANYNDWDFDNTWAIFDGETYPYLRNVKIPDSMALNSSVIDGKGTENEPYVIKNKEQLKLIKYKLSAWYKIANDIDLQGEEWVPLGSNTEPFSGHLDGGNFTISNLKIDGSKDYQGLFAATQNAVINNVNFKNTSIEGNNYIGGLAGSFKGNIDKCTVQGKVYGTGNYTGGISGYTSSTEKYSNCNVDIFIKGGQYIGGVTGFTVSSCNVSVCNIKVRFEGQNKFGKFVGNNKSKTSVTFENCKINNAIINADSYIGSIIGGSSGLTIIKNCSSKAEIKSSGNYTGGLVGNSKVEVSNSYFSGKISSTGDYVGGIVGYTAKASFEKSFNSADIIGGSYVGGLIGSKAGNAITLLDCYSLGELTGVSYTAGIIGKSTGSGKTSMTNVYAATKVNCVSHIGGLSGDNSNVSIVNSYYDKELNNFISTADYGKETKSMTYKDNFIDWDYSNIWAITEGETYPYLRNMEVPSNIKISEDTKILGKIVNAKTGEGIKGIKINIRKGIDNKDGDVEITSEAGDDGVFEVKGLACGDYTVEFIMEGYVTTYCSYNIKNGENNMGDISVMPVVEGNKMTIVLSIWTRNNYYRF